MSDEERILSIMQGQAFAAQAKGRPPRQVELDEELESALSEILEDCVGVAARTEIMDRLRPIVQYAQDLAHHDGLMSGGI